MTEDEMVGWYHQFSGHELGQTSGDGEGQRGLACCRPWGHKVGYDWVTEQQKQGQLIGLINTNFGIVITRIFWDFKLVF